MLDMSRRPRDEGAPPPRRGQIARSGGGGSARLEPLRHRDAAMILIGYRHGLRASELCDLQ